MIQDTRIAVPPTNGVQLKIALMVAPRRDRRIGGDCIVQHDDRRQVDHGPVQATTTATSTMIGSQAMTTSPPESPCASAWVSPVAGCAAIGQDSAPAARP